MRLRRLFGIRETDCSIHLKLRKNRFQSLTSDF